MDCCRISTDSESSEGVDDTPGDDVFDAFQRQTDPQVSTSTRNLLKTPVAKKPVKAGPPEEDPSGVKAFEGMVRKIENEILKSYSVGSVKDQEDPEKHEGEEVEEVEIILVVQSKDRTRVKIRTTPTTPFGTVFEKYRQHMLAQGEVKSETEFVFLMEGEPLKSTDLPINFDCETDDIIDVVIKNPLN